MDRMTPAEAGAVAVRARKLLRLRMISHHQFALLDALLWSCRTTGRASTRVSYGQLQARATVAAGLAVLERLGLLQRIKEPRAGDRSEWRPRLEAADVELSAAGRGRFTRVHEAN